MQFCAHRPGPQTAENCARRPGGKTLPPQSGKQSSVASELTLVGRGVSRPTHTVGVPAQSAVRRRAVRQVTGWTMMGACAKRVLLAHTTPCELSRTRDFESSTRARASFGPYWMGMSDSRWISSIGALSMYVAAVVSHRRTAKSVINRPNRGTVHRAAPLRGRHAPLAHGRQNSMILRMPPYTRLMVASGFAPA